MTTIFDYIPIITVTLFAAGLVGAIVYERMRSPETPSSANGEEKET